MGIFDVNKYRKKKYGMEQKHRPKEEIQKDFMAAAAELGSITYEIAVLQDNAEKVKAKLARLNMEGYNLEQSQPKEEGKTDGTS